MSYYVDKHLLIQVQYSEMALYKLLKVYKSLPVSWDFNAYISQGDVFL